MNKRLLVAILALIAISVVSIAAFAANNDPIIVFVDDPCHSDIGMYGLVGTISNNGAAAFHTDEFFVIDPDGDWFGLPVPTPGLIAPGQTIPFDPHFVGNSPTGWYRVYIRGWFEGTTTQVEYHGSVKISGHCTGNTPVVTATPTLVETVTATPTLVITTTQETVTPTATTTEITVTPTETQITPIPTIVTTTPEAPDVPALACQSVDKPAGLFQLDWEDGSGNWQFGAVLEGGDGEGSLVLSEGSAPEGGTFRIVKDGVVIVVFTIHEGECIIQNDPQPTPEITNKAPCADCGTQQNECFVKGFRGLRNWYFDARQATNAGRYVVVTQDFPFSYDGYNSFSYQSLAGEVSLASGWELDMVMAVDDNIGTLDAEGNHITDLVPYESCSLACEWAVMIQADGTYAYLYIYGATVANTAEMIRGANPEMSQATAEEHATRMRDAFKLWGNANPHNTFAFFTLDGEVIDLNYPESPR